MKNKNPTLTLIFSIISLLVTLAAFVLFVRIIFNKNVHTGAVLASLKSRMIDKENFSVLEDKIKEVDETHKKIDVYFLNKSEADLFVDYLEKLGIDSGTKVEVKNVNILDKVSNTIEFNISISGNFSNVMKTILILENVPYNVSVNNVYINEEIKEVNTDPKLPKVSNVEKIWVADVTFNILSI